MSKKEFTPAKPKKLTVPKVIEYCKNNLGITFNLMDEEKAKSFLEKNNFFFRIKQYCSTCTKLVSSPRVKEMTLKEIKDFFDDRMVYRKQYFENKPDIKNAYRFARRILDYYSEKSVKE